jgi:hypothetical protein
LGGIPTAAGTAVATAAALGYMATALGYMAVAAAECVRKMLLLLLGEREEIGGIVT